jgi:hypothetical protein
VQYASKKPLQGMCFGCFHFFHPQHTFVKNYKTKEKHVQAFLASHFQHVTMWFDQRIDGGCSRRRPDVRIDLGYRVVIVEIDENEHAFYNEECERVREQDLALDLSLRPYVLIRFNPDSYVQDNVLVPSCWRNRSSDGKCVLRDEEGWKARLQVLRDTVARYLTIPPPPSVEQRDTPMAVERLFYSNQVDDADEDDLDDDDDDDDDQQVYCVPCV